MSIHPIIESPRRWIPALLLLLVAAVVQAALLMGYADASPLPAVIDSVLAVGLFGALAYFAWFVRVHRSTIVNVTQISRVELFGKENYRLLLKNGTKLRVSHSGYRLLKERLGL